MTQLNPDIHHRRSIRLKNYDYSRAGAYFVTVCVQNRECLFGDIDNGEMRLNEFGRVVENEWLKTKDIRGNVKLDYYIIMPNHFHGILVINDCRGVLQYAPTASRKFRSPSQTIGAIVRGFKSAITKHINETRNNPGCPVWQRNYYEHIIRNEKSMNKIREYITKNPLNWTTDIEHPCNKGNRTAEEYYKHIVERL
ncbi:MAG: transposase [Deltaproteobacteria bacterium]|nr:transposase [Deltaproteobacteria bacterium]